MIASAPYVIAPVELIVVLYRESWKRHSGSGTTLVAAAGCGRRGLGIDIDQNCRRLARERLALSLKKRLSSVTIRGSEDQDHHHRRDL